MLGAVALVVTLSCLTACSESDSGSPAGTQIACDEVAQSADEILIDPEAHAGELGTIIGAAESSDDVQLRAAADRFNNSNSKSDAFLDILTRCRELGLA
jgi:hypothetical protein